jgi:hypothetical protein
MKVNSAHIAMLLAADCFGYRQSVKRGPERLMQSPEVQQAKLRAAREKRLRKQLKRVQEGH